MSQITPELKIPAEYSKAWKRVHLGNGNHTLSNGIQIYRATGEKFSLRGVTKNQNY